MISDEFAKSVMPILFDIGKTIFMCTSVYATYYIMRKQYGEGVERAKAAAIGYICMRSIDKFIDIVDKVTSGM